MARFGATSLAAMAAAACLLLVRCTGTSVDLGAPSGSVSVHPPDDPAVRLEPTWELHPTMMPTPTATPIA
jgi:hypothetical protein